MKNFKRLIACVMAIATLGSATCIPMSVSATTTNDVQMVKLFGGSYHYDEDYYKEYSVTGTTGIIMETTTWISNEEYENSGKISTQTNAYNTEVASLEYYYHDDTTNGIVKVDSLDLSKMDNIIILKNDNITDELREQLLTNESIDLSQCDNISYSMPYFYNQNKNEYTYYYYNGNFLLTRAYLPNQISTSNDIITYLSETYDSYTKYYLNQSNILNKPIFSALNSEVDNFSSGDDFLYYLNESNLAQFYSNINCSLCFESENPNLTVDDVLTKEQQDFMYFLESKDSEDYCININLSNNGVSEITGLTRYSMYLPKCKGNLSYNDFMVYKYKIAQNLLDTGVIQNAHFIASAGYDDYNIIDIDNTDIAITMKDGSAPTKETFGKYADGIESIELVNCEDGTLVNGESSYYRVTLVVDETNQDDSYYTKYKYSPITMILDLQQNQDIKSASAINYGYLQTEMASLGKSISYEIPILPNKESSSTDKINISDSQEIQPTDVRGDINYDGKVDGKDLMLLKKYILGLITW